MEIELMSNNYANVALAPHGSYWREIRKIVVLELVSHWRLQMLAHIRVSEVNLSIYGLYNAWISKKGSSEMAKVDMKEWLNINLRRPLDGIRTIGCICAIWCHSRLEVAGFRWLWIKDEKDGKRYGYCNWSISGRIQKRKWILKVR